MLRDRWLDMTDGFLAVRRPISVGPESGIVDDRIQPGDGAELAPQIVVGDPDHDRAIGGLECLVGTKRLVARTAFRRLNATFPIGLQIVAQQTKRGFEQRYLDRASSAGFFPRI